MAASARSLDLTSMGGGKPLLVAVHGIQGTRSMVARRDQNCQPT